MAGLWERSATLPALVACAVIVVLHQGTHADWFIDDAAICFAYARNLATGEGLVPWPGGERVEAYSDPTWIALLAAFHAMGLDGFATAKPLGMLFGVASLPVAWRIARFALPDHDGDGALVAPVVLALNAQFAIWSASGLENALFAFLLALLIERTLAETGPEPPSAIPGAGLVGLLLVWTRPEGMAYVAVVGAAYAAFAWRSGRGAGPAFRFASVVVLPSALLEGARLAYFAWPLPTPYYAKLASNDWTVFDWNSRGWVQLRAWSVRLWHVGFAPFYAGALAGVRKPGGRAVALCAATVVVGLGFSLLANGDWMGAYRFLSLFAVPQAVLLGVGLTRAADGLQRAVAGPGPWGDHAWIAVSVVTGLLLVPNFRQTRDHLRFNHDETTASVKQRVDHTRGVLRTTFWTEPVTTLEVDQGAHLWWAPDYRSLDLGGLVDVPMAHHWFQQRAFVEEYVFSHHQPTFAHLRGWWAQHTGLLRYPPFERGDYLELPPYRDLRNGQPYPGVYVHRSLVVAQPGTIDLRPLSPQVAVGPVVVPHWVPGREGYLEVPLAVPSTADPTVLVGLLEASGSVRTTWSRRLGYGLLDPSALRDGEVYRNRFAVPLPEDVQAGDTLAVSMAGGPWWELGIVGAVGPESARATAIARARRAILRHAAAADCPEAEAAYVHVERHRPTDWTWHATRPGRADDRATIAACWATTAARDPDSALPALARAHRWDAHHPELRRVGDPIAEALWAEALHSRDEGDLDGAFERLRQLLMFQPWRAWARREAETLRDRRLGLIQDVRIGFGGDDDRRRAESEGTLPPSVSTPPR